MLPPRKASSPNASRESNWRYGADQQIANNSAAQRGAERQHHEAEQIEIAVDRRQCTLEGKDKGPHQVQGHKQPAGVRLLSMVRLLDHNFPSGVCLRINSVFHFSISIALINPSSNVYTWTTSPSTSMLPDTF